MRSVMFHVFLFLIAHNYAFHYRVKSGTTKEPVASVTTRRSVDAIIETNCVALPSLLVGS